MEWTVGIQNAINYMHEYSPEFLKSFNRVLYMKDGTLSECKAG